MSQSRPATYAGERSALATLARHEIVAYLKHPLFLVGVALLAVAVVFGDDDSSSLVPRDRPGHLPRHLRPHGDGRPGTPLRPGAGRGRHRRAQRAHSAPTPWPARPSCRSRPGWPSSPGRSGTTTRIRRWTTRCRSVTSATAGSTRCCSRSAPCPRSAVRSSGWSSGVGCTFRGAAILVSVGTDPRHDLLPGHRRAGPLRPRVLAVDLLRRPARRRRRPRALGDHDRLPAVVLPLPGGALRARGRRRGPARPRAAARPAGAGWPLGWPWSRLLLGTLR